MKDGSDPIAIVGMSCWFAGARNPRQLWENSLAGRRQFRLLPRGRLPLDDYYNADPAVSDRTYGRYAAVIDGFNFDWQTRRIPQQTFRTTDVAHWLSLEVALSALADAGMARETLTNDRVGVVVGNTLTGDQTRAQSLRQRWPFVRRMLRTAALRCHFELSEALEAEFEAAFKEHLPEANEDTLSGGLSNTIAGRICNYLDIHGGGYTVDGACASSLLAVATAMKALRNRELDVVIAGGVDVSIDPFELVGFAKARALATREMRVYDARADGFIPGEGCGFVVLRRADDALRHGQPAYALLRGCGISSDGRGGITAPSVRGQLEALQIAYADAKLSPCDVDYFEGHGTGTPLGDRVELEAVSRALGDISPEAELRPYPITSLKSLIGHTKAAAGIASVIRAAMAATHHVVPPTSGFAVPAPAFAQSARALYPVRDGESRPSEAPFRIGVSAMGFGGINCHVVIESGDRVTRKTDTDLSNAQLLASAQDSEVFVFGADSATTLRAALAAARSDAVGIAEAECADLAAQLASRVTGEFRAACVASSVDELLEQLTRLERALANESTSTRRLAAGAWVGQGSPKRVGLVFPGQGSQQLGMGRSLLVRYDWARVQTEHADAWLRENGHDAVSTHVLKPVGRAASKETVRAWEDTLSRTEIAQPAIALSSLLWLGLLERLGVRAHAVAGHSLGELIALHAASAFDARTLILLAAERGAAMAACPQAGGMVAMAADEATTRKLLSGKLAGLTIANMNSYRQTVVAGEVAPLELLVARAAEAGVACQRLRVSRAFHSALLDEAAAVMRGSNLARQILAPGTMAVISSVTGSSLPAGLDLRAHLAEQVIRPVDFIGAVHTLIRHADVLLEVGAGRALTGFLADGAPHVPCCPVEPSATTDSGINEAVAMLHVHGHRLNWSELFGHRLLRNFVTARERIFIESPCERGLVDDCPPQPGKPVRAQPQPQDVMQRADQSGVGESGDAEIARRLLTLVSQRTGYPSDQLGLDNRLLDDLNLDSLKSSALLGELAAQLGVGHAIDPTALANAPLSEVVAALAAAAHGCTILEPGGSEEPWARAFVAHSRPHPWPETFDVRSLVARVWCEAHDNNLASDLKAELLRRGATSVAISLFEGVEPQSEMDHIWIALYQRTIDTSEDIVATTRSLWAIRRPPQGCRIMLVQVGAIDMRRDYLRGFAASLHQERPDLVVRAVDVRSFAASPLIDLLATDTRYASCFLGAEGTRLIQEVGLLNPAALPRSPSGWSEADLVLVTGGTRGISLELALGWARAHRVRVALVGRSLPTSPDATRATERFSSEGLSARYFCCDVTDRSAVSSLISTVRSVAGEITGLLHGAGANSPGRLARSDLNSALQQISPKAMGAANLLQELRGAPLKTIVALTSIIGVTGLDGNSWYAFANQTLRSLVLRFVDEHPTTRALSIAYSAWRERGMGAAPGVAQRLQARGVDTLSTAQGVDHFLRLLTAAPDYDEVIVTSRLGDLSTWRQARPPIPPMSGRFLEQLRRFEPQVELQARCVLNPERDRYLKAHDFRGSLLFPAVFGLEAMGQAVAGVLEQKALGPVSVERLQLRHPIIINHVGDTELEVRAVVDDGGDPAVTRVRTELRSAATNFSRVDFSCEFVLKRDHLQEDPSLQSDRVLQLGRPTPDLDASRDLYDWLLFQRGPFRRLGTIHQLTDKTCEFGIRPPIDVDTRREYLLGDLFALDALLQSAQLVLSQELCLPVAIERFEISPDSIPMQGSATYEGPDGADRLANVKLFDVAGNVTHRIDGYRLRVVETHPEHPAPKEIADPQLRDNLHVSQRLQEVSAIFGYSAPEVRVDHLPSIHDCDLATRRERELPLLTQLLSSFGSGQLSVDWSPQRQPLVRGGDGLSISLSHDENACVCVAGFGPQGCDVVPLDDLESLRKCLGFKWDHLIGRLQAEGMPELPARATVLSALEAARKASQSIDVELEFERRAEDAALLHAKAGEQAFHVITLVVQLARGPRRMMAFVGSDSSSPAQPAATSLSASRAAPVAANVLRVPVTFREACLPSGHLYFTNFFSWMGRLRELAVQPILSQFTADLTSGRWTMVTNSSEVQLMGSATVGDVVEGTVQLAALSGRDESTMELSFTWTCCDRGSLRKLARTKLVATWAAVVSGRAQPRPLPRYMRDFIASLPASARSHPEAARPTVAPRTLNGSSSFEQMFDTTLEDSNFVGNIYFANYGIWQGRVIDRCLRLRQADRDQASRGEFRTTFARVEHLREARPFDRVAVVASQLNTDACAFAFDYFQVLPNGTRLKIATGENRMQWFATDTADGHTQAPCSGLAPETV